MVSTRSSTRSALAPGRNTPVPSSPRSLRARRRQAGNAGEESIDGSIESSRAKGGVAKPGELEPPAFVRKQRGKLRIEEESQPPAQLCSEIESATPAKGPLPTLASARAGDFAGKQDESEKKSLPNEGPPVVGSRGHAECTSEAEMGELAEKRQEAGSGALLQSFKLDNLAASKRRAKVRVGKNAPERQLEKRADGPVTDGPPVASDEPHLRDVSPRKMDDGREDEEPKEKTQRTESGSMLQSSEAENQAIAKPMSEVHSGKNVRKGQTEKSVDVEMINTSAFARHRSDPEGAPSVANMKAPLRRQIPSSATASSHPSMDLPLFTEENAPSFLRRDQPVSRMCRELIRESYCEQSKIEFGPNISNYELVPRKRKNGLPPLGPILSLEIGGHFDTDQLWEEIELRNKPLLSHVQRRLRYIRSSQQGLKQTDAGNTPPTPQAEVRPAEVDDTSRGERRNTEARSAGIEKDSVRDTTLDIEGDSPLSPAGMEPSPQRKVRFAAGTKDDGSARQTRTDGAKAPDSVEDGFFSLEDMEMFANDAEQLAVAGKLAESDDDDDDDDDDEKEEDSRRGFGRDELNSSIPERPDSIRYADFFDPPSKETGANSLQKVTRVSELLGTTERDQESDDDATDTPLVSSRARSRKLIEAIEEESVGKKAWQLRGEVAAHSRPKDSLLNTTMDHDTTGRPGLLIDGDRNEMIEDLIRQRVVDGLFDDVVPALPENYDEEKSARKRVLPEISQEKPTESLAEVYAREFVDEKAKALQSRRSQEVEKEVDVETPEQKEVNRLFEKLATKLDALSGLHFTPTGTKGTREMTVKGSVKALASEEAIPEAVSDTNMLAPREVYAVDKKNITGEKETTKDDRRAARGRAKRGAKKSNEAKRRAARLMDQADPLVAEKRRAEEAILRRRKKIRIAQPDSAARGNVRSDAQPSFAQRAKPMDGNVDFDNDVPLASNLLL